MTPKQFLWSLGIFVFIIIAGGTTVYAFLGDP
jgi:hypothetical protein